MKIEQYKLSKLKNREKNLVQKLNKASETYGKFQY